MYIYTYYIHTYICIIYIYILYTRVPGNRPWYLRLGLLLKAPKYFITIVKCEFCKFCHKRTITFFICYGNR